EEAMIGHILGEGVFEEIAVLWEEAPVVDQPQRLQMLETVSELVFPLGNFLEELQRELPPDDCSRLNKPFLPLWESVDPGRDHILDRIWDLPLEGALREDVALLVLLQGTHLQEGLGQLLYVEGITLRLLEDESLYVCSHRPCVEEFLHQCYTFSLREALQDQTGVVGAVSPRRAIAWAIGRKEEDWQGQDTIDQRGEECLRGRIHPVQVLQNQDEGATAALAQEQGLQRDKDLPLLQLGPLVGHGRTVDLDGKQRQEGRGELLGRKSRIIKGRSDPLHHRRLGLLFCDLTARLQQVNERQVGDDPAIGETTPC